MFLPISQILPKFVTGDLLKQCEAVILFLREQLSVFVKIRWRRKSSKFVQKFNPDKSTVGAILFTLQSINTSHIHYTTNQPNNSTQPSNVSSISHFSHFGVQQTNPHQFTSSSLQWNKCSELVVDFLRSSGQEILSSFVSFEVSVMELVYYFGWVSYSTIYLYSPIYFSISSEF